jgi:hypothetical protein
MWKFLGLLAVVLTALFAMTGTASAQHGDDLVCNETVRGGVYDDVLVPRGGSCTLTDATVAGNVRVLRDGYFQSTRTAIGGSVYARDAVTVFIDSGSRIFGSLRSYAAERVFVFDSVIVRNVRLERTSARTNICGTTVLKGDVNVERGGGDILIGDPQTVDCAGNVLRRGDLEVERTSTDVEFVIRGNIIRRGELDVVRNNGPAAKFVEDNVGGREITCRDNSSPFFVGGNTGWDRRRGQCA